MRAVAGKKERWDASGREKWNEGWKRMGTREGEEEDGRMDRMRRSMGVRREGKENQGRGGVG